MTADRLADLAALSTDQMRDLAYASNEVQKAFGELRWALADLAKLTDELDAADRGHDPCAYVNASELADQAAEKVAQLIDAAFTGATVVGIALGVMEAA